jgi:hypothetical protein
MARRVMLVLAPLVLLLHSAAGAQAEPIIWDFSPATTGSGKFDLGPASLASGQNIADSFSIARPFVITGMDSYSFIPSWGPAYVDPQVGQSMTIRLYADASGSPGPLLTSFTEPLSAVDKVGVGTTNALRLHTDFTNPISLGSGTYWIGMSGTTKEFGVFQLMHIWPPPPGGDHSMATFQGTKFWFSDTMGDMAFRLEGIVQAANTPEPGSLTLLALGALGLAGHAWRKRRRNRITRSAPCTAAAPAPGRAP